MGKRVPPNTISADPGEHCGLVLWEERQIVRLGAFQISKREGANAMADWIKEAILEHGVGHLVVEQQYPRPGRSFRSVFGLAAYRGAVEHECRKLGIVPTRIKRIQPQEWKGPAIRLCGAKWSAKDRVIQDYARALLSQYGVGFPVPWSRDVADAVVMGHWHLHRGLYA